MKHTGEFLKQAREKKNITLAEVAHATKINIKILEAIESGQVDHLPQKAFLRGFIQSYAKYLKLDSKEVLNKFQEEVGQTKPAINQTPANTTSTEQVQDPIAAANSESPTDRKWFFIIGAAVLLGAIIIVQKTVEKYEKETIQDPQEIQKAMDGAITTTTLDPALVGLPVEESPVGSPTASSSPSASSSPAASPLLSPSPSPSATPTPKPTATPTPTPKPTPTPTPTPKATPKPTTTTTTRMTTTTLAVVKSAPQEVIVEALDSVTLEVRINDGKVQKIKLSAEQVHTFKGPKSIQMEVSDGGAINVTHNGRDRGVPGTLGKPMKLKYP